MRALLILILLFPFASFAQKEGDNWTFADSMGLKFDVENDTLSLYKTFIPYLSSGEIECQATISDSLGNLLFYLKPGVNGLPDNNDTFNIYLRGGVRAGDNSLINNGDSLFNNPTATNGSIFLRHPLNPNKVFSFNLSFPKFIIQDTLKPYAALFLNIIDVDSQKVVDKNQLLYKSYSLDEKIAAVRHADGKSWWLFIYDRKNGRFVRFLLNENGINEPEFQNIPNSVIIYQSQFAYAYILGEMVFSEQGDRLAFSALEGYSVLFDFDRCTGLFSNPRFYSDYNSPHAWFPCGGPNCIPYSCAFSPDGGKLYAIDGAPDSLVQYDLTQNDLFASRKLIYKLTPAIYTYRLGEMENGPDGRIYFTSYCDLCDWGGLNMTQHKYLHAIDYPDRLGDACGLHLNKISLNGHQAGSGLPNMPNWRLKGLPLANAGGDPRRACGGDSVRIGAPRQSCQYYKWKPAPGLALADSAAANPKAAPPVTTTYTLTTWIDGSDEISVDSVTVWVVPFPNGYITAAPDTFSGAPFTVHFKALGADTSGLSFHWDFGDQTTGTGAITSHTYPAIDGYLVKLFIQSSSGTCKDTLTYNLKLTLITGLDETKKAKSRFKINPNPARERFTLEALLSENENAVLNVFDAKGANIATINVKSGTQTIETQKWGTGIYYCKIISNKGNNYTAKVIVLE